MALKWTSLIKLQKKASFPINLPADLCYASDMLITSIKVITILLSFSHSQYLRRDGLVVPQVKFNFPTVRSRLPFGKPGLAWLPVTMKTVGV